LDLGSIDESIGGLLQQAVALHTQGQMPPARAIYTKVLALDPAQPDALHLLGVLLTQSGDAPRGAELIEKSLALNPSQPIASANLGHAQLAARQLTAALASYDRSIARLPDYAPAHNGRGSALTALQRPEEALPSFDRALALMPNFPEALDNRGLALLRLHRFEEAIGAFSQLLALRPDDAQVLTNRAIALCALWRYAEALADCDRALRFRPDFIQARYVRGVALLGLGRNHDVLAQIDVAHGTAANQAESLVLRGNALRQLGRRDDAVSEYERALELRPGLPAALVALGTLETSARRFDRAATIFARLLEVAPDEDFYRGVCLHAQLHIFDWSGYTPAVQKIVADVEAGKKSDLPFTLLSITDDPELQQKCARAYVGARPRIAGPLPRAKAPRDRLRIAYVSADFLEHPIAYLLAGLFEAHDRNRFETIAVSLRADDMSPMAQRLQSAFDRFIDVSGRSDEQIAGLIAGLDVDIAVDLMGYTAEERPGILGRRPAPIQVNYLGFPATMASEHIDYLMADEFVIPPAAAPFYSESIAYLPQCFQANDDRRVPAAGPAARVQVGLPADGFVWCAFHASVKINPPLFDVWMQLLHTVPNSVLWLISNAPTAEINLRREAGKRGIDPARLVFAKRQSYPQHLARLSLADLCLDTWPFNGGATTSDALWRGVPVVTMTGGAFSSRMSGSLLRAAHLPELVTDNVADYQRVALALATDRAALMDVRSRLNQARTTSPLFDTAAFRRHVEAAYTIMWERQQRGEAAATFRVPL
jgi:protein O-GlcNAc transferase